MVPQKRSLEVPPANELQGRPPKSQMNIPQRDGAADESTEPQDEKSSDAKADQETELGEEDDLADVDDHEEINEEDVKNRILGTFEKVHRTKSKWRLNLKNCVATINGREYLFKKIAGDLNFA